MFFMCLIIHFFLFIMPHNADADSQIIIGKDNAEMVLVPHGEFVTGLAESEPGSTENPLARIFLPSFYIDRHEVTNALYKKCVASGPCKVPSLISDYPKTIHEDGKNWYSDDSMGDYPVVGITWRQAGIYCEWAGKRLPTRIEWEKAARGTEGAQYPWGNSWDGGKANWDEDGKSDGYKKIAPVGRFPEGKSPYGAMDMAGNVREWVDEAILKGGSWYSLPVSLRSGDPGHGPMVERDDDMGFRCAADGK